MVESSPLLPLLPTAPQLSFSLFTVRRYAKRAICRRVCLSVCLFVCVCVCHTSLLYQNDKRWIMQIMPHDRSMSRPSLA